MKGSRQGLAAALALAMFAGSIQMAFASQEPLEDIPAQGGAILVEAATGQVLFEKDAHTQAAPASITKIMAMILVMEEIEAGRLSLEEELTCSEYASHMGGSEIWLEVGEKMTVDDLLKAVFVASANDATVVFAEHIAGSENAFVQRMNEKAGQLGMEDTNFVNCTGFDEEGHVTSAYDVAIMARELMKYPLVREYTTIWMDHLRGGETQLVNTNRLIRFYSGATGLKTGTTDDAGMCLCATAERDGLSLISVVLNCGTSDERFQWSQRLLDHGFSTYAFVEPPSVDSRLAPIPVRGGMEPEAEIYCQYPSGILLEKDKAGALTQEVQLSSEIQAPVELDEVVGKVVVAVDGEEQMEYPVKAKYAVEAVTVPKAFARLGEAVLSMRAS